MICSVRHPSKKAAVLLVFHVKATSLVSGLSLSTSPCGNGSQMACTHVRGCETTSPRL